MEVNVSHFAQFHLNEVYLLLLLLITERITESKETLLIRVIVENVAKK